MDAHSYIAQLCIRHHVSMAFGRSLQPLVERAVRAEPTKRRLLLEMVERSFVEEARRARELMDDWRALTTVAGVLHGWSPPSWFDRWGDLPGPTPPA